jgi:hypothetical protein
VSSCFASWACGGRGSVGTSGCERSSKARAKSAARTQGCVCKLRCELEDHDGSPCSVSLRAQRSNPESFRGRSLDCFAALAKTVLKQRTPIHRRHPRAMAKPLSLEARARRRTAPRSKPRRATARLQLGRASFEARDGALCAPSLAPQDDGGQTATQRRLVPFLRPRRGALHLSGNLELWIVTFTRVSE